MRAHTPLQDVAVLVLVGVAMKRGGQRPWGDGMFHQREPPAGIFAPDHKPDAEGSEVHDFPVARTNQARTSGTRRAPTGWCVIHSPLPDRYTAALAPP